MALLGSGTLLTATALGIGMWLFPGAMLIMATAGVTVLADASRGSPARPAVRGISGYRTAAADRFGDTGRRAKAGQSTTIASGRDHDSQASAA